MPYVDRHIVGNNFSRDEALGLTERGEKLDGEFRRLSEVVNQLNSFVRQTHTTDAKLKLDQAVRVRDVIDIQLRDGDGVTDTFTFDQPIDAAVDLVRTFVDDGRVDPAGYDDNQVVLPAPPPSGTENVQIRIYTNMAGVLDRIQDLVAGGGAGYIGYDDPEGRYVADNTRDALTEVKREFDNYLIAVGDIANYLLRDGSRTLTGQWDVNEPTEVLITPVVATGTVTVDNLPVDGDTLVISDGLTTITFEFDDDSSVGAGNTPVTIGTDNLDTGATLVTAINNAPLAVTAVGTDNGTDHDIALQNQVPGVLGNVALQTTGAWPSNVTGMAGGVDGSYSGMLKTYFRLRKMPRSLEAGDAVVHEQLLDIITQVQSIVAAFLRVDGSNQMINNLQAGGNKVVDMAPGTDATDAVNLAQLQGISGVFIPSEGKKSTDYAGQATITGPLSFNQAATDLASAVQDDTADNPTLDGVPTPNADNHVTNKLYVDAADTSLQNQINDLNTDAGLFPAGGCGLGDGPTSINIEEGGEYHSTGNSTITSPSTPGQPTAVRVSAGDLNISSTITMDNTNPEKRTLIIDVDGNVTISAIIADAYSVQINATGNVTLSAAITAEKFIKVTAVGDATVAGDMNAELVFIDANTATVSGTVDARPGHVITPESQAGAFGDDAIEIITNGEDSSDGTVDLEGRGGGGGAVNGGAGGTQTNTPVAGGASGSGSSNRPYLLPAGNGGYGGKYQEGGSQRRRAYGGGRIVVFAIGNLSISSATLQANGESATAAPGGFFAWALSAGGGGSIKLSTGAEINLSSATLEAKGGNGLDLTGTANDAAGGGGGCIMIQRVTETGSATTDVSGGNNGGATGQAGQAGTILNNTFTAPEILCMASALKQTE